MKTLLLHRIFLSGVLCTEWPSCSSSSHKKNKHFLFLQTLKLNGVWVLLWSNWSKEIIATLFSSANPLTLSPFFFDLPNRF